MKKAEDKGIFKSNKVRLVVFLCLALALVLFLTHTLTFADAENTEHVMDEFYALDRDSVDCIYFGSSATQRAFVEPLAWHNDGIAEYSIASGTQPFILTKYLMEEALKTQSPELFIVEMRTLCKGPDRLGDVACRRILDNMKMSSTKRRAIEDVTEYASHGENQVDKDGWSYYFPFLKYHSRWNPSLQPKYWGNIEYYNGYALDRGVCFKIYPIEPIEYTDATVPLEKENEEVLNELLDYCDSIDVEVLFVISPYQATETGMGKLNYAQNIVESRGYTCLNFLPAEKRDKLGLQNETCYYNKEHLNYYGSLMYTEYLSGYIKSICGIKDRRGDKGYADYDKVYERFAGDMETLCADNYNEMMAQISETEGNN